MALTEEDLKKQLQVIEETNPKGRRRDYPDEIKNFISLADMTTLHFEKDGLPYTVYQFVDKDLPKDGKAPVFVSIHGGGWIAPHLDNDIYYSALMAHQIHGIVFSPDYTTADKAGWQAATSQCYETAKYAAEHAAELGGDPDNISVGGYSAGGHLTSFVTMKSLQTGDFHVRRQIFCYAPLCLMQNPEEEPSRKYNDWRMNRRGIAFEKLFARRDEEFYESPLTNPWMITGPELRALPETLVITAERCPFHEEDEIFAARLSSNGVPVTCRRFLNSGHGFIPHFFDEWKDAVAMITKFIVS